MRPGQVHITKVTAHQSQQQASSPLEEWCFWHNAIVDKFAAQAQFQRDSGFWTFYQKHVSSVRACHFISRTAQQVLLEVSKVVVQGDGHNNGEVRDDLCVSPPVPQGSWLPPRVFSVPVAAVRWYGDELVRSILSWFWFASLNDDHPVQWISHVQLYTDFMLCGGNGPIKRERWETSERTPEADLALFPFLTRTRWFAKVLKESLRHSNFPCLAKYCRPASAALMMHTGCLAIPWPAARIQWIDEWLYRFSPGGFRRSSSALCSLPVATRDGRFPGVFTSSA